MGAKYTYTAKGLGTVKCAHPKTGLGLVVDLSVATPSQLELIYEISGEKYVHRKEVKSKRKPNEDGGANAKAPKSADRSEAPIEE